MNNVTIIGSGFAGLTAARELRKHKVDATITMISPRRDLHFLPSTIWIPAGIRDGARLKVPLESFLGRHRIDFVEASVTGLRDGGRLVVTDRGEYRNDHLVVASGGRFIRKLPGIAHTLIPCEGIAVGEEIGRRLDALKGGTIAVGGEAVSQLTPARAHALGIACIYQQPALFPELSVAENLGLRLEPAAGLRRVDWKARRDEIFDEIMILSAQTEEPDAIREDTYF